MEPTPVAVSHDDARECAALAHQPGDECTGRLPQPRGAGRGADPIVHPSL
jgi:hypothetical protein